MSRRREVCPPPLGGDARGSKLLPAAAARIRNLQGHHGVWVIQGFAVGGFISEKIMMGGGKRSKMTGMPKASRRWGFTTKRARAEKENWKP